MPDDVIADTLAESVAAPKSMTTPDGTVVQHDLGAQIAADKYRRQRAASRNPFGCLRLSRVLFGRADGNPGYPSTNPDHPTDVIPR